MLKIKPFLDDFGLRDTRLSKPDVEGSTPFTRFVVKSRRRQSRLMSASCVRCSRNENARQLTLHVFWIIVASCSPIENRTSSPSVSFPFFWSSSYCP